MDIDSVTLTIRVNDYDMSLGCSAALDVKPLCELDVLNGTKKRVNQRDIAIVPEEKEEEEENVGNVLEEEESVAIDDFVDAMEDEEKKTEEVETKEEEL